MKIFSYLIIKKLNNLLATSWRFQSTDGKKFRVKMKSIIENKNIA
jgi:hypothetical protein